MSQTSTREHSRITWWIPPEWRPRGTGTRALAHSPALARLPLSKQIIQLSLQTYAPNRGESPAEEKEKMKRKEGTEIGRENIS